MQKYIYLKLLAVLVFCWFCQGSGAVAQNKKLYYGWVTHMGSQQITKGIMYDVTDSLLILSIDPVIKQQSITHSRLDSIHYSEIHYVRIRRKGKVWKSILIGGGTGMVLGGILGYTAQTESTSAGWDLFSREEETMMGGISGLLAGGMVGSVVGITNKRITIGGNLQEFKANQQRLFEYSLLWGGK